MDKDRRAFHEFLRDAGSGFEDEGEVGVPSETTRNDAPRTVEVEVEVEVDGYIDIWVSIHRVRQMR